MSSKATTKYRKATAKYYDQFRKGFRKQLAKLETPPLPMQPAPVNIQSMAAAPVNATGLTTTETALLSPGEQAIRQRQKGIA